MDWKGIMATVVGSIIIGALMFVFNSIGEGKHERDEMRKDIEYVKEDVTENKDGIAHIWVYNDSKDAKEKDEMKESFKFALDMIQSQHETELKLKDLEIQLLKK